MKTAELDNFIQELQAYWDNINVQWHVRWHSGDINSHSYEINYCYRILFNPVDQSCGKGIVEECNCKKENI